MAWLAVDGDGGETIFEAKPVRMKERFRFTGSQSKHWIPIKRGGCEILLPQRTIEKIIGKKLTWENEPVEI